MDKGYFGIKRLPGICCPEPACDHTRFPLICAGCSADCLKCSLRAKAIKGLNFSKMSEGQALYTLGARAVEKDGKKGLQIRGLFIEASDEQPELIVASQEKRDRVRGAKKTRCRDCRHKVWISPSTQELLTRYPGTPVICLVCFVKRAEKEKEAKDANGSVTPECPVGSGGSGQETELVLPANSG